MRKKRGAFLFLMLALFALSSSSVFAWYDHEVVMGEVLKRLEAEIPSPAPVPAWDTALETGSDQLYRYSNLASLLLLNPQGELPSVRANTPRDLLRIGAEDPDHGMDRDLPDTADPSNDRKFMGGTTGSSSSGFRHMYWAGWKWEKPIATFQIPPTSLGQAPDRVDLLANEARDRIRKGDLVWGFRILGWTIHYLQDLTQPFHAVQLPSLRMVPWNLIPVSPISEIFPALIKETTRTITNYHWAYEGYVRHALKQGDASPLKACFEKSGGSLLVENPRELALMIAERSIGRSRETGKALYEFVGSHLKDAEVSVPKNPAIVNVDDLLKNPDYTETRRALNAVTCESLRLSTDATIWIVNWALKSGK